MNIKLPTYKGGVLKTAGKYHAEDITLATGLVKYNGIYENIIPSYTVTLRGDYAVSYSIDSGNTWVKKLYTDTEVVIDNVKTIMFKNEYSNNFYTIFISTGGSYTTGDYDVLVASIGGSETSDEISITSDITYYVSFHDYNIGGLN